MSSVDNRVVNMQFNNRDFASKIADTMVSLQKLDKALQFKGGTDGLNDVEKAMNGMDFSGIEAGVQSLTNRFSTLGIIGMEVVKRLTNGVIDLGKSLVSKALNGGISRAMNLEHAKFMLEGIVHDSAEEARIMEDVMDSVDGTAYSLDQAANVAAQFVATGMKSGKELQTVLKGVTGLSAVFDADYQRVGQVFTQVSAQGRVYANDLLSLSSMSINARAALVKYYQEVKKQSDVTIDSIDEMVRKGQVDFDTFGKAMAYNFGDQAKEANRTFNGAMSNVNAHLAQIGAKFVTPLVEAKESLDGVGQETYNLIDILNSFRLVIDRVRDSMGDFGVYDKWAKGVSKVSEVITKFFNVISTDPNKDITGFLKNVEELQKALGMNDKDFKNLVDTFYGFVDAFRIVKNVVSDFLDALLPGNATLAEFGSKILEVTGAVGRYITYLRDLTDKTDVFTNAFETLGKVIEFVGGVIQTVFGAIFLTVSNLVGGAGGNISAFFTGLINFFKKLGTIAGPVGKAITSIFGEIKDVFAALFKEIGKAITSGSTDRLIDFFQILVSGGIGLEVISFLQKLQKLSDNILTGFSNTNLVRKVQILFGNLNKTLTEFTVGIRIDNLLKIAKAVGILAASLLVLSLIKPERLMGAMIALQVLLHDVSNIMDELNKITAGKSLKESAGLASVAASLIAVSASLVIMSGAVMMLSTVSFGSLVKGLVGIGVILAGVAKFYEYIDKNISPESAAKIGKISRSMIVMGIALNILAFAVKQLAALKPEELFKGLIGIGAVLLELAVFMKLIENLSASGKGMASLIALAASLLIIAKVVKTIGKLKPEQLAKGLVGLGFVLLELAAFIKLTNGSSGILTASLGMLALAKAMEMLTGSLKSLGNFSEEQLAKGLLGLAGSLLIIAGAMRLMPTNMLVISAGLYVAAAAIQTISDAMSNMGGMSEEAMAKSLIELAGALGILAVAMKVMNGSLVGAAAMLVVAAALAVMVPPLKALGEMSLQQLVISLLALAGALTIFGIAGTVLAPVTLALIGLGVAITLFGVGLLAAGVGVMSFIAALVMLAENVDLLIKSLPAFIDAIVAAAPKIGFAGSQIMLALIKGAADNIGQIVTLAVDIVINFINAVAEKIPDIVNAGMNLAISFINGIADGINQNGAALRAAIGNLIGSIVNFVLESIQGLLEKLGPMGEEMAKALEPAKKAAKDFFGDGKVADETKKGADKVADVADKGTKKAGDKVKKNLKAIPDEAKKSAKQTGKAFDSLPGDVGKTMDQVAKEMDISKNTGKQGKKSIDEFQNKFLENAKKDTGTKAGNKVNDGLGSVSMSGSANNMYAGFSNSFMNHDWYGKGASAAREVNRGFQNTVKEHSPSRLWAQFATYLYVGLSNRMKSLSYDFYNTGVNAAKNLDSGFTRTAELIANLDLSNINAPTIRPVMDLSGVKMGVDSINSMFNGNRYALNVAGQLGGVKSAANRTFNITNNLTVNGAEDPKKWADEFAQELEIQARTM